MSAVPREPELFAGLPPKAQPLAQEFAAWWRCYPHKVDKGHAERMFVQARRIATLEELVAGVARYVMTKPVSRPWCNPGTWLRGKRWLDEPADSPSLPDEPVDQLEARRRARERLPESVRRQLEERFGK